MSADRDPHDLAAWPDTLVAAEIEALIAVRDSALSSMTPRDRALRAAFLAFLQADGAPLGPLN